MRRHLLVVHLLGFAPATEPHDWNVAISFQTGYDTPPPSFTPAVSILPFEAALQTVSPVRVPVFFLRPLKPGLADVARRWSAASSKTFCIYASVRFGPNRCSSTVSESQFGGT